jgi:altronate dehydratase small subunit
MNDTRLLLLDERDNVFVARARIRAGEVIEMENRKIAVPSELPIGHKLARRAIPVGATVIKYGAPIGSAIADIALGEHTHVHNVKSNYTPTYHLLDEARAVHGDRD